MGCLGASHMVLCVSVPGFKEPPVGAMFVPSTQTLSASGLGTVLVPYLWVDGADFASSQEMPW